MVTMLITPYRLVWRDGDAKGYILLQLKLETVVCIVRVDGVCDGGRVVVG